MGRNSHSGKSINQRRLFLHAFLAILMLGGLAIVGLVGLVSVSPATGSMGADLLRSILGPQPVADLEAVVFTIQDNVHHALFILEGSTPSAPWAVPTTTAPASQRAIASATSVDHEALNPSPFGASRSIINKNAFNAPDNVTPTATTSPTATFTPTPTLWAPVPATPIGSIPMEAIWEMYIQNAAGVPVAYRTFLQPDPTRPYATVAVVAFDLSQVELHYQLGTEEPAVPGREPGTGQIPDNYRQPGILLAAFNGGFKTIHGHYGVIIGDATLISMINGIGTLAIYNDGRVRIGEWGFDMKYTPDMLVARQNCPLMVQKGQINPLVYNNSVSVWGGTIEGNTVTLRSGVGLSQDGKTLYYFAGNYLTMPALASAMVSAGAYQAMQLDINNYYVLLTSFKVQNNQLVAVPLLPKEMSDNAGRFLESYVRDFFYLTAK